MPNILIITNIAPLYRSALWEILLASKEFEYSFCFGNAVKTGIKEIDLSQNKFKKKTKHLHSVKNIFLKGKILFWQKGVLSKASSGKYNTVIISGDAYVISNWLAAIVLKIRGIKVVFWGHGFYGNESGIKKYIRKLFFKLAHQHLLYERQGKKNMIKEGFNPKKLHVVFNSLNYSIHKALKEKAELTKKSEIYPFFKNSKLLTLIFIGRLTKIKKLDLFVKAVNLINKNEPHVNALFVGDGSEKNSLMRLANKQIENRNMHFFGACYSEEIVSKLLTHADLCVSPGNVGLTAIHSLSFGTPVCTHNNFDNQMPEVESIKEKVTGYFFEENNLQDLIDTIKQWLETSEDEKKNMSQNCRKIIDQYYNPDFQLKVISNMLHGGLPIV